MLMLCVLLGFVVVRYQTSSPTLFRVTRSEKSMIAVKEPQTICMNESHYNTYISTAKTKQNKNVCMFYGIYFVYLDIIFQ